MKGYTAWPPKHLGTNDNFKVNGFWLECENRRTGENRQMFKPLRITTAGQSLDVLGIGNNEKCVAADLYFQALHRERLSRK
jgi:hypothetical protein